MTGSRAVRARGKRRSSARIDRSRDIRCRRHAIRKPIGATRVDKGRSVRRGRESQSLIVAGERLRREPRSNLVIGTAATRSQGHVARFGNVSRVRKVSVNCSGISVPPGPIDGTLLSRLRVPSTNLLVTDLFTTRSTKPLPQSGGRGANPRPTTQKDPEHPRPGLQTRLQFPLSPRVPLSPRGRGPG